MSDPIRAALERLLSDIQALSDSSQGIEGLHRNGDPAPWDELLEGGCYSSWLGDAIADGKAALAEQQEEEEGLSDEEILAMRSWSSHGPTLDSDLVAIARAAIALDRSRPAPQPPALGEGPSADKWDALVARAWEQYIREPFPQSGDCFSDFSNALDLVRQELARWGHQPAPPAEGEAIGPEWKPCVKLPITVHVREQRPGETHVSTREGITPVQPDDLIMRGVQGEEYPIGRELFNKTYRLGAAEPTPPAEGEVAELVEWLRLIAGSDNSCFRACLRRTAQLLQQQVVKIQELEQQLETEHLRVAVCGVTAMCDTPESAARNRGGGWGDYWSASADDIARQIDELMRLRAQQTPVPVEEEPWKREGWCDEDGFCWFGWALDPRWPPGVGACWSYCKPTDYYMASVSAPAHALPMPQGEVQP